MSHRPRVVLLAFDACDIGLVRKFAAMGKLPTFHRLLNQWACAPVQNPNAFFVNSVWPSFYTAKSEAKLGFHCWETVTPGYEYRLTSPLEVRGRPFWHFLGDAGRRVAVLDVPHSRASERQDLLEVSEYGAHDRHFGLRTSPRALRDEIISRFGLHPIFTVQPFAEKLFAADDYVHRAGALRTGAEETLLLQELLVGLQQKADLSKWVYHQSQWDFFMSIFGESHAIGHQSWYLHDPAHPRHNPALVRSVGDPVEQIYAALDRTLAEHLEWFGPDSIVFVLLSHGMRAHYDGTYVLEPALARFDAFSKFGVRGSQSGQVVKSAWLRLGRRSRDYLTPPLMAYLRSQFRRCPPTPYFEQDIGPITRSRQRYFMSPNNTVYGGVRINLKGREAGGLVKPVREFDVLCDELKRDLLSLINVDTGDPVVLSVERTDSHYERDVVDELPDLLIHWNHEAPVEKVWSPKTGLIHAPYWHWRTGDHRPGGFLLASGPQLSKGIGLGRIENRDLGPTICALLGVELTNVDGRPVPALLGTRE